MYNTVSPPYIYLINYLPPFPYKAYEAQRVVRPAYIGCSGNNRGREEERGGESITQTYHAGEVQPYQVTLILYIIIICIKLRMYTTSTLPSFKDSSSTTPRVYKTNQRTIIITS